VTPAQGIQPGLLRQLGGQPDQRSDLRFESRFRQLRGQLKWQDSRRSIDQLIAAGQLFRYLSANCSERKPEHENQLRPLTGLTPEQAQTAWERAAEKASDRKTTAQMVKSAVKELQPPRPLQPKGQPRRLDSGCRVMLPVRE
jgi:hypothetical protein